MGGRLGSFIRRIFGVDSLSIAQAQILNEVAERERLDPTIVEDLVYVVAERTPLSPVDALGEFDEHGVADVLVRLLVEDLRSP